VAAGRCSLDRETHPQPIFAAGALSAAPLADKALVLQQVQVRALDITVLKGSGQAIVDWCRLNGFLLNGETRAPPVGVRQRQPDPHGRQVQRRPGPGYRQLVGDGAPVLITMKLDHPWVPLEVLANGVAEVNADIYLITPDRMYTSDLAALEQESPEGSFVPHVPGLAVQYQQPVSDQLHRDLSTDKNMGWMQPGGWLTHISLSAPATSVTYDMGVSRSGVIHVAAYGTPPVQVTDGHHDLGGPAATTLDPGNGPSLPPGMRALLLQLAVVLVVVGSLTYAGWRRRLPEAG
jgi:hypothetical protein